MDVKQYTFGVDSEKETAYLLSDFGLECVSLNWKLKNDSSNLDLGEIDGIFRDVANQFYIIYDDSTQKDNRQEKISKFLNKWKDVANQKKLREDLSLKNYPIYIIYIDKSEKHTSVESINYTLDEYTKIIYRLDFDYFLDIYKRIGKWGRNDFFNFLSIRPRQVTSTDITATLMYYDGIPAFIFADRVENILNYSYISRRRDNSNGYQRMIDKTRVQKMSKLIEKGIITAFPNSILLNCIDGVTFTALAASVCPKEILIKIPNQFSSCRVVDGQHRLLAFSKLSSNIQDSHSLPIVLFNQMPDEKEIKTFIEINDTQKRIDPNLIYILKSDMNFQSGTKENLEKLAVNISKKLNNDVPFFKDNIKFGNVDEKKGKSITLTSVVQTIIESKIINFTKGTLQIDEKDIETPYKEIKNICKLIVDKTKTNIPFYKTNNGAMLILRFGSLLKYNLDKNNLNISIDSAVEELIKSINRNFSDINKRYGKAGFNSIVDTIFTDLILNITSYKNFEYNLKTIG